jgi:hypothetical protein
MMRVTDQLEGYLTDDVPEEYRRCFHKSCVCLTEGGMGGDALYIPLEDVPKVIEYLQKVIAND